jgi:hypothetical protein
MRSRLALAVLAFIVLGSSLAFASRPPQEWTPPPAMTPEQIEAQKIAMKQKFNAYGKDIPVQSTPIPWMALGLAGLAFAVAAPFAYKAYKNTSKDIDVAAGYAQDFDEPSDRL